MVASLQRLWRKPLVWIAAMACLVPFGIHPGPDAEAYRRWLDAVTVGNLTVFPNHVLSPTGIPLWQWSAGPGLLLAVPWTMTSGWMHADLSASSVMLLMACLTISAAGRCLWRLFGGDWEHATILLAALWFGTPTGYYALAFSSEMTSLCALAVLGLLLCERRWSGWTAWGTAGAAVALLIMVRPNLALFGLPTLVDQWSRSARRHPIYEMRSWIAVLWLAVPPLLACWQVATVNGWMTGNWWQSPYSFGDEEFRSIDLQHPEWLAILCHPLHGAFVYHPLILLGLCAEVWLAWRADDWRERCLWGWFFAASVLTAWLHAGWMCWWLAGLFTFGMRGLVVPGAIALVALGRWWLRSLHTPQPSQRERLVRHSVEALAVVSTFWSWVLFQAGPTDFFTWSELFSGWLSILWEWYFEFGIWRLLISAAIVYVSPFSFGVAQSKESNNRDPQTYLRLAANLALVLLVDALLKFVPVESFVSLTILLCSFVCATGILWLLGRDWSDANLGADSRRYLGSVSIVTLSLFAGALWSFSNLYDAPELTRQALIGRGHEFPWQRAFYMPAALVTHEDYLSIPGFTAAKTRLSEFLRRQGALEKSGGELPMRDTIK